MLLTIFERGLIMKLLPTKGTFDNIVIINELRNSLGLSEDDHKNCDIKYQYVCSDCNSTFWDKMGAKCKKCKSANITRTSKMQWNREKDKGVEIPIGGIGKAIVAIELKSMDEAGEITEDYISVYRKFVLDKN